MEGGSRKDLTIQFFPLIPFLDVPGYSESKKEFHAYPLVFDIRLLFKEGNEKIHHINDFFICNLPYNIIDEKIKTIKPI
ncbi:MAG: hypothetical protein JXB17_07930 [Bacteroidales bacterium]|nr:hypothetical protein [Bacteroidales bacterium]